MKFQTRWDYPIYAIKKAVELDHNVIWYVYKEGTSTLSKFLWNDNDVVEEEALLDDNFYVIGMKKTKINAKNWKLQMTYCGIMTMKAN